MPYLRLLTNALVAGALGAAMLAHLVLLLNPQLPLQPRVLFSLGWRLLLTAGPLLAAGFFIASLARYLATRRGPGWLSLRILAWTTTLVVATGALLAWLNVSAFQPSLTPAAGPARGGGHAHPGDHRRRAAAHRTRPLRIRPSRQSRRWRAARHRRRRCRRPAARGAWTGRARARADAPCPGRRRAAARTGRRARVDHPAGWRVAGLRLAGRGARAPAELRARAGRRRVADAVLDRAEAATADLGVGRDGPVSARLERARARAIPRWMGPHRPAAAIRVRGPAGADRRVARRAVAAGRPARRAPVARPREFRRTCRDGGVAARRGRGNQRRDA